MYTGTVVIKGTVFSGQAYWPVSTSGTVKCVFTKGSTVKAGYGYGQAGAQAQFIVGTYNESTGAITEEGTATLIVGDTTVSISGHGNGYDSTGLHTK